MSHSKRSQEERKTQTLPLKDLTRDERPSTRQASLYDAVAGSSIYAKDRVSF